jgi:hypothetical protein
MKVLVFSVAVMIALMASQSQASDLLADPCAGAIRCSPGSPGRDEQLDRKIKLNCTLTVSKIDSLSERVVGSFEVITPGMSATVVTKRNISRFAVVVKSDFDDVNGLEIHDTQAQIGARGTKSATLVDYNRNQQLTLSCSPSLL